MKTRKVILLIVFILGIVSLLILSSFISRSACEYAHANLDYIKIKTEAAIGADNYEQSKYHAFKALNSIEKTRANFVDCGCNGTIESLEAALFYLKDATKAKSFSSSKRYLHTALENLEIGSKVLKVFEQDSIDSNVNQVLLDNTQDALNDHEVIILSDMDPIKSQVHNCLLGFESSLAKVVTDVDCKEAYAFISNIHEDAGETLLNTELSAHKKEYHNRVRTIAMSALNRLGKCNNE
ncbi:hypothetical protein M3P19_01645 [Muricauda sp. 2012CJ35-5]|uniref:Uncharacterized protein n=1 Tax=Flagellimonas spongiicola TaxID=2942208 RepID=A0ABT0PMT7_9FLAO|nr:hypothetical protein [Allomuricauda spongiicola]MCL6272688.1 hypothetical protein [Allomuricauda spongiicola]